MAKVTLMIDILIVDDHEIMRKGLNSVFKRDKEFRVVGEAKNGSEALSLLETASPDLVVMDIKMPDESGVEVAKVIKKTYPDIKIAMLSAFCDMQTVEDAIKADVDGYLLKETSSDDLVKALKVIHSGEKYLHPIAAKKMMNSISHQANKDKEIDHNLTERELKVLQLITEGYKNREIAAKLFLGEETVKTHVSNILCKLNCSDRTQAALYAIRHGLVENIERQPAN